MLNSKLSLTEAYEFLPEIILRCGMKYALISEWHNLSSRIIVHKFWNVDHYSSGFEYDLKGSPCEWVFKQGPQCFDQDVQKKFPDDHDLVKLNIQVYVGVPILNQWGEVLGHVAMLDDEKHGNCQKLLADLIQFAGRISF